MTLFAKLSLGVSQHPRFFEAGPAASGYWMAALDWLRSTESRDGILPASVLSSFYGLGRDEALSLCSTLVRVGLFADLGDGRFELLRYSKHNETGEQIEARKSEQRERMRAHRAKSHRDAPTSPQSGFLFSSSPQPNQTSPPHIPSTIPACNSARDMDVPGSGSGSDQGSSEGGEPRSTPPPPSVVRARVIPSGRDTPPDDELDWAARAMAAAEFGNGGRR